MNNEQKDSYFVAVKVFLEKDGALLILKDRFGDWDLPGGRIQKDEFGVSLDQIIKRKISEELGEDIQYSIGRPLLFMRHERIERILGNPMVRIFAIGYEGILQSGTIRLSERHTEMLWIDPQVFQPEKYFEGGWLKGVEEYLNIRNTS
ncbi:MAG: NUDIX domain-containing protein [Candidatus Magasanikbacteria bacterium]|nr:NUDIX domain-containing protein [Candidatus Magasanikbacteria bacterium]